MKIIDPSKRPAEVTDNQTAVRAIVDAALVGAAEITFEAVRAAMPAGKRAQLTDGVLHQIAIDANYKVEP